MASKDKSFEELVAEAPPAPAAGTVSLVGTLAQSSEVGKFVLTLQDGSAITVETAAVKGHEVLGTSVGQTIVRVDVEAEKLPSIGPTPGRWHNPSPIPWLPRKPVWSEKQPWEEKVPVFDKHGWEDNTGARDQAGFAAGNVTPFALATPQQVPPGTLAALQGGGPHVPTTVFWADLPGTPWLLDLGFPHHSIPWLDAGATGVPPYLD